MPASTGKKIAVIGGPCSIESEEQAVRIAREVKDAGGCMLRGGAYKPRTSPYDFSGLGAEGLRLLIAVGIFFLALLASTEFFDLITRSLIPGDAAHNTWCFVYGILLCWLELAMAFTCGCFLIGNGRVLELRIRS